MKIINISLKHHTPQVRREAEQCFITLYSKLGDSGIEHQLNGHKKQFVIDLVDKAKQNCGIRQSDQVEEEQKAKADYNKAQISDKFLPESLINLFGKTTLNDLNSSSKKKKQKAIVEIKKNITKNTVNLNRTKAKQLFDPISILIRQILADKDPMVYLEGLKLLKFAVSKLAPHLDSLDLNILIGSYVGIIVSNQSTNMSIQIQSDKVIIFLAKHSNIGPYVVARDILRNMDKITKVIKNADILSKKEVIDSKRTSLTRFMQILQLLVGQFQTILFYEAEFNRFLISNLSELISSSNGDMSIKNLSTQILNSFFLFDQKTLEVTIQKLPPLQKAPILKILIELESLKKEGIQ